MRKFQYCPIRKYAIERSAATDSSMTSTITTNDSATSINQCFTKWGLNNDFEDVPPEIEFDLTNQVSLHIGANICGILGDIKGDSGTIRTDCSDATSATSKSILPKPINYLIKRNPQNPVLNSDSMQVEDSIKNASTSSIGDEVAPDNRPQESGIN